MGFKNAQHRTLHDPAKCKRSPFDGRRDVRYILGAHQVVRRTGAVCDLAGIVLFAASLILLAPLCWRDRKTIALEWRRLLIGGAFTGAAFGLYTVSLFHTDVVRSILLFYLTPIWGTLLGLIFLGERLGLNRVIALALGVLGLRVVLGDGLSLPWPKNLGDTLALLSGITWAFGTLGLYKAGQTGVTSQIMAFIRRRLCCHLFRRSVDERCHLYAGGCHLGDCFTWVCPAAWPLYHSNDMADRLADHLFDPCPRWAFAHERSCRWPDFSRSFLRRALWMARDDWSLLHCRGRPLRTVEHKHDPKARRKGMIGS